MPLWRGAAIDREGFAVMMQIQRDSNGNQFWPCQLFNDGVPTRLVPAYIGGGKKLHAVDELSLSDGRGAAMCGRSGWMERGTVLEDGDMCASCARLMADF